MPYITSGDLLSMAGSTYLNGVWNLDKYSKLTSIPFEKHVVPVLNQSVTITDKIHTKPSDLTRKVSSGNTHDLSDFLFTYLPDADYFALQVAVAAVISPVLGAALTFRGTTELSRQAIGSVFNGVLTLSDLATSAYIAAKSYTSDMWNAIIRQSKIKLGISPSTANQINSPQTLASSFQVTNSYEAATTARSLTTIDNFWDAMPDWEDDAWQATTKWSEDAWNSIDEWIPQTWQRTTTWTAGDWNQPFFVISNSTITEEKSGTNNLVFKVTLSTASTQAVTVVYATADNTATAGSDYTAKTGTLTFAPGQISQDIIISVNGDSTIEPDETFFVNLSSPSNANITDNHGLGTIIDSGGDAYPPIITLNVSPASVTEDGATNLIYTFSRTADTSAPLTVNYTVAGSATPGGDYSGLAATPATKSITFAAGSATATLTVDPTADTDVEPDETVELSLVAGTNYTISSIAPVIGTIIDGQTYTPGPVTINRVNLGTMNVGYAIRNGNGAPLPVIYAGINASPSSPGNGWAALAATTSDRGYFLYWRNSTTLSAARWELNSSGVYTSGIELSASQLLSEEATLSLDLNGDGFTSGLYTINGVNLGGTSQGYAIKSGSSAAIQITYSGINASPSSPGDGWAALAATNAGDGYSLYWRNGGTREAVRWELNSSGAYTSGILLSASQLISEEMTLKLDLNGDGYISIWTTSPGLNLGSNHQGYVLQAGSAVPIQITYGGLNASPSSPGAGWAAITATRSGNGFTLYWRNNNTLQAALWDLDSSGTYVNGTFLSTSQLISDEAILNLDLNGDGYTAGLGTINGVNLGSTSLGYALQTGGGAPVQVTYPGGIASASNPGDGWSALAALPTDNGYAFYWSNSGSGLAARWNLDHNGVYQSGTLLDASQLIAEEMAMNADLNGDAIIGPLSTTIEGQGNASLLRQSDGLAAVLVDGTVYPVSSPFGLGTGDADSTWQMLAAETVAGQNQILWRNNPENFLHVWTLDPSWSWQSSYGAITPSSAAALGLESSFLLDLNADGSIG